MDAHEEMEKARAGIRSGLAAKPKVGFLKASEIVANARKAFKERK